MMKTKLCKLCIDKEKEEITVSLETLNLLANLSCEYTEKTMQQAKPEGLDKTIAETVITMSRLCTENAIGTLLAMLYEPTNIEEILAELDVTAFVGTANTEEEAEEVLNDLIDMAREEGFELDDEVIDKARPTRKVDTTKLN